MAETVAPSRDGPLILGGVSFGGMLAYEMARYLKPAAVVLIASCRRRESLRPSHVKARGLLRWTPVQAWWVAKLVSDPVMRIMHRRSAAKRKMLVTMFKESDSRFMHWVLQAILDWESTPLAGVPVFQIHGGRDIIIPARRVKADLMIPGGGHMINVSRAEEVNAFIVRVAAMAHDIPVFHAIALEYCMLIDSLADGRPDHLYKRLLDCMSRLAKCADRLPQCCCPGALEGNGYRMTHEKWGEIVTQINNTVGPEVCRLIEADKEGSESAIQAFMLSDSLADIYRDLHEGLQLFDQSSNGGIQEAAWEWKFGYEHHWRSHLIDALKTIDRIQYELRE
jgi:hypothetical protein